MLGTTSAALLLALALQGGQVSRGPILDVSGTHSVRGYVTRSGKVVRPHIRSNPNNTVLDNLSYPKNKGSLRPR